MTSPSAESISKRPTMTPRRSRRSAGAQRARVKRSGLWSWDCKPGHFLTGPITAGSWQGPSGVLAGPLESNEQGSSGLACGPGLQARTFSDRPDHCRVRLAALARSEVFGPALIEVRAERFVDAGEQIGGQELVVSAQGAAIEVGGDPIAAAQKRAIGVHRLSCF